MGFKSRCITRWCWPNGVTRPQWVKTPWCHQSWQSWYHDNSLFCGFTTYSHYQICHGCFDVVVVDTININICNLSWCCVKQRRCIVCSFQIIIMHIFTRSFLCGWLMLTAPVAEPLKWDGTNITVLYPTGNGHTTTPFVQPVTSLAHIVSRPVEDDITPEVIPGISGQPQNFTGDYDPLVTTVGGIFCQCIVEFPLKTRKLFCFVMVSLSALHKIYICLP